MNILDYLQSLTPSNQVQYGSSRAPAGIEQYLAQFSKQSTPLAGDDSQDLLFGGMGNDQIMQPQMANRPSQGSVSKMLNDLASGKGNLDYDAIQNNYPTPRQAEMPSQWEAMASNLAKDKGNYGLGGSIVRAYTATKDQELANKNANISALNKRDMDAFSAMMELAKQSGMTQREAAQLAQQKVRDAADQEYKRGMLGVAQSNANAGRYVPVGMDAEGNVLMADQRTGNIVSTGAKPLPRGGGASGALGLRKLPVGTQKSAYAEIDRQLGLLDAKGRIIEDAPHKLLDEQRAKVADAVVAQLQSDPNLSIPGAVSRALQAIGGTDWQSKIKEQTQPGKLWGTNETGYRMFDDTSGIDQFMQQLGNGAVSRPEMPTNVMPSMPNTPSNSIGRTVVKRQYSPSLNKTKVIYSDGTEEIQ